MIHAWGLKIVSMPVDVTFTRGGAGRVGMGDVLHMFGNTLEVFVRLRMTDYYKEDPVNPATAETVARASEIRP
jgi:hypothetical protein